MAHSAAQRLESRLRSLHGVLSVDEANGCLWVNVATLDSLSKHDVWCSKDKWEANHAHHKRTQFAGLQVFKVIRRDTSTVSALEAAFAVECEKAR